MKAFPNLQAARERLLACAMGAGAIAAAAAPAHAVAPVASGGGDAVVYTFEAPDYSVGELDGQQGWTADFDGYWAVSDIDPYDGTQHMRLTSDGSEIGTAAFSPVQMGVGTRAFSIATVRYAQHQSGAGSDTEFSPLSAAATNYDPFNQLAVTRVFFHPDGSIQALQPGQFVATTGTITDDAYHEVKVIADNSGNAQIEICLDGVSIFTGTNIAATTGTTSFIDSFGMLSTTAGGSAGSTADFDDIHIIDSDTGGCADASSWNFDGVVAPALPTGWSSSGSGSPWQTETDSADTAPNAAHASEAATAAESDLVSATATVHAAGGQLSFRHHWNVEQGLDGGVLEISINGGTFVDIVDAGGSFVEAGYNGSLGDAGNPLGARPAWTGQQQDFVTTTVDLPDSAAGQAVSFRWRLGSNASGTADGDNGWWIDTVALAARVLPTQPAAVVAPDSIDVVLDQGGTTTASLSIANAGGGTLTYDIPGYDTAPTFAAPRVPARSEAIAGHAFSQGRRLASGLRGRDIVLGGGAGIDIAQMSDNAPVADDALSCGAPGTSTDANSWWRRFYFNEYSRIGASANIDSVVVAVESGPTVPVTINLYAIPHGATPESIPLDQLTPIGTGSATLGGTLQQVLIPVTGTITDTVNQDLVVEYHIDGSSDGEFFPGGNATPQTHTTFISASGCGQDTPIDAAAVGYPDFHLIMIVNVQDATLPTECTNASDMPWLGATPPTGAIGYAGSADVTLSFDGAALSVGEHDATMCVTTNDATQPVVQVPLHVTVNGPADRIFADDFEGS
jgi:hypothetical protein